MEILYDKYTIEEWSCVTSLVVYSRARQVEWSELYFPDADSFPQVRFTENQYICYVATKLLHDKRFVTQSTWRVGEQYLLRIPLDLIDSRGCINHSIESKNSSQHNQSKKAHRNGYVSNKKSMQRSRVASPSAWGH